MINTYGRDDIGGKNALIYINIVTRNMEILKEFHNWATTTHMLVHMSHGTLRAIEYHGSSYLSSNFFLDSRNDLAQFKLRWQGDPNFIIEAVIDMTDFAKATK